MKVSLIQTEPVNDVVTNIAMTREMMVAAIERDRPDLVVLPENFHWAGGGVAERLAAGEIFPDGPAYRMCQQLASKYGVNVHSGSIYERIPGEGRNYGTTVVFDRQGKDITRYHKIHMFDIVAPDGAAYRESQSKKPGQEVVTVEIDGVTVGLAICYDLRFAELFIALERAGAEVIVLPAMFTLQTGKDHWEVLCRARAIETQTWFIACGAYGKYVDENQLTHYNYGHSLVVDPWGHVTAKASDGPGFVTAYLDLDRVKAVRDRMPIASQRRLSIKAPHKV